jgi:hypothetical protein
MKKLILLLFFAGLLTLTGFAQEKITRYCFIKPFAPGFGYSMDAKTFYIDYGQKSIISSFKDSTVIKDIELVKKCKSYADVVNYMVSIGWSYVSDSGESSVLFTFKREFDKSEIEVKAVNRQ